MKTNLSKIALIVCLSVSLVLSACGAGASAATPTPAGTSTPPPTNTPTPIPTATSTPTRTPRPTITPNLAATQQYEGFLAWVEKLEADGVIPSVVGNYHPKEDYSKAFAKSAYYTWMTYFDLQVSNFIIQAKVTLANETVENAFKSGCGFVFSSHAIFFSLDGNVNFRTDGYDRGSNYIDATIYEQNPDGVTLTLVLSNKALSFYVNDRLALKGITVYDESFLIGPAVLSSTSEGFGTRCDFTQIAIWDMD